MRPVTSKRGLSQNDVTFSDSSFKRSVLILWSSWWKQIQRYDLISLVGYNNTKHLVWILILCYFNEEFFISEEQTSLWRLFPSWKERKNLYLTGKINLLRRFPSKSGFFYCYCSKSCFKTFLRIIFQTVHSSDTMIRHLFLIFWSNAIF